MERESKIVPILFPKIQEFVNMMLGIRNTTTAVPKTRTFLFALVGNPSKWINGSSCLRRYAVSCGANSRNINLFTVTKTNNFKEEVCNDR